MHNRPGKIARYTTERGAQAFTERLSDGRFPSYTFKPYTRADWTWGVGVYCASQKNFLASALYEARHA